MGSSLQLVLLVRLLSRHDGVRQVSLHTPLHGGQSEGKWWGRVVDEGLSVQQWARSSICPQMCRWL